MIKHVVIIGAGPAGLTAAYLLSQQNIPVTVLESDPDYVGGIARTVFYKGYGIDIGGHRFFSKSKEVECLWNEILPNDLLTRPRQSRIYYRGIFYSYPLKALEALVKLGILESTRCVFSYLYAKCFPIYPVVSFSDWVTNRFGKRLYEIFFESYTEKVWGMRCEEISADWAAQRIQGLSLISVLLTSFGIKTKSRVIKTLINSFRYPRKGSGMLWEECASKIKNKGGKIVMGSQAVKLSKNKDDLTIHYRDTDNILREIKATHVISSASLRELATEYVALSSEVQQAAQKLKYRDFIVVVVILKDKNAFPDNWIYIHSKDVDVARIQNYKSWSKDMVPEVGMTCYGMEYFCFKDDKLWLAPDEELISKAKQELLVLGLAKGEDIQDSCVIRQSKAYPVYDQEYQDNVKLIREELGKKYPQVFLVGRNGMHMYNNQDHSMMTAMLTVKNIIAGSNEFDVWDVNQDAEHIESVSEKHFNLEDGVCTVPQKLKEYPVADI